MEVVFVSFHETQSTDSQSSDESNGVVAFLRLVDTIEIMGFSRKTLCFPLDMAKLGTWENRETFQTLSLATVRMSDSLVVFHQSLTIGYRNVCSIARREIQLPMIRNSRGIIAIRNITFFRAELRHLTLSCICRYTASDDTSSYKSTWHCREVPRILLVAVRTHSSAVFKFPYRCEVLPVRNPLSTFLHAGMQKSTAIVTVFRPLDCMPIRRYILQRIYAT